jgi:hypothetical protein
MQHLSIPMANLGFNYNLEIESWKSGFSGFRVFSNGQREPLEGGLGIGLDMLMSLNMSQQFVLSIIPTALIQAPLQERLFS